MPTTRTTVILDEDLLKRTKLIAGTDSTTEAVKFAMDKLVRQDARSRLGDLLGTDDTFGTTSRRRAGGAE
jgi:Arc/MetJ family transcription regulator